MLEKHVFKGLKPVWGVAKLLVKGGKVGGKPIQVIIAIKMQ